MRRLLLILAAALAVPAAVTQPVAAAPGPADAQEYWFDSWRVQSLWAHGIRGQGVTIAEIDSGVNASLPELRGRILPGHDFGAPGNGHIDRDRDAFGHGTAMASIMVARSGLFDITGIAPGARILPLAVPLRGTTTAGKPDKVPQAIRYAVNHGADIISMSLGGNRRPGWDSEPCDDDEQSAIFYALRKGALVVAAVGNTGPTKNTIEDPGVCLGVISVGAVNANGRVASFSGRQPYLTLVAPGVNVPSLGRVPGQAFAGDGTSQATALTSATAALVWSAHPHLDAREVATRILATLDRHRRTPSPAYGYGLLDAYRAATAAVPVDAPNPVFDAVAPFLSRVAALRHRPAPRPKAAAGPPVTAVGYAVGSVPWLTSEAKAGIAMSAAGFLLLVALATVGVRARRRRPAPRPLGGPSGTEWALPIAYPLPANPVDEGQPRPRPRPTREPPG